MPSQKRITRAAMIKAAVDILRDKGYEGVNARKIAEKLNCSTQPIYSEFTSMDQLKEELVREAEARYVEKVKLYTENSGYRPYMAFGLGYIRFAKEEKQLFRYLYMRESDGKTKAKGPRMIEDVNGDEILEVMTKKFDITEETAVQFHYDMAIYTYGLAVMVNTGFMTFDEKELIDRLWLEFIALAAAYGVQVPQEEGGPV